MRTLLDELFAPITSQIGYLELPVSDTLKLLAAWREGMSPGAVVTEDLTGHALPESLRRLEPLTAWGRPREIVVETGDWTAYFDCSLRGTDAVSAIGYLCTLAERRGIAISTVPHTVGSPGVRAGRLGSLSWELFAGHRTGFLNYERSLALVHNGRSWDFVATGEVQPYEETAAYRRARKRDRLTSQMIERYCRALGVDPFNAKSYGPQTYLVSTAVAGPSDAIEMTLADAQAWLEIVPGSASALPG